jgi:hypothetical protein
MTTKIKSGVIADNAIVSAHISSGAISSGHLSSIDTDAVSEGSSNLYFTTTRARTSLSVTDSGGDGSLAYDNSTGAITYTGPSASEVRAHLSAGTGVTYSSGEFSIGQSVATTASPTFADINVTGNINVTGDLNTVSVTDLDVTDQTITLGAGQNEAASDGSGIVIAGSSASILWDEPNDEFDFNKSINVTGNIGVSGTVDGVDIAARDAVLTSTTTTAGAALPKAGGTMTGNIAHASNFTLDVGGDINLDAGGNEIKLKTGGTEWGQIYNSSSNLAIYSSVSDKDLIFQGNDGGSVITALTLDMSNAGAATFNSSVRVNNSAATPVRLQLNNTGSNDYASIYADTASAYKNLILNPNGGNVGIGTVLPGEKLHVYGNARIEPSSGENFIISRDTAGPYFGTASNHSLRLITNSGSRVNFDTDGRVLIGVTSGSVLDGYYNPRLQIEEAGSSDSATRGMAITYGRNSGGGGAILNFNRHAGTSTTSKGNILDNYSIGEIVFRGYHTNNFDVGAAILARVKGTPADGVVPTELIFSTTNGSGSHINALVIAPNQKIGIGTEDPDTLLELRKDTASSGYGDYPTLSLRNDNAAGYSAIHFQEGSTQRARVEVGNNSGTPYMGLYTTSAASGIMIKDGNVGIGTDSPDADLHVEGVTRTKYLRFQNLTDATSEVAGMYSSSGAGTNDLSIYASALSSTSSNIKFLTAPTNSAATTTLFLEGSSGNVGIGTASPTASLTIHGADQTQGSVRIVPHTNKGDEVSHIHYGTAGDWYIRAASTSGKVIINDTGGNVGIGLDNPLNKFVVAHQSHGVAIDYVGATLPYQAGLFTSSSALTQTAYGDLNIKSRSDYTTYGIGFFTANVANTPTLRMKIDNTGNVGIGDTSPGHKLEVKSTENYKAIHIKGTNAPCYTMARGDSTDAEWRMGLSGYDYNDFAISTSTGTNDRFRMDPDGNSWQGSVNNLTPRINLHNTGQSTSFNGPISSGYAVGPGGARSAPITRDWFTYSGGTSIGSNRYVHMKTNLYGGSGNNTEFTMSLFHYHGFYYYGANYYGDGTIGWHNWSGSFYNVQKHNYGNFNLVQDSYVSSDGYVVLVADVIGGYAQFTIDWHQWGGYGFRDKGVTNVTNTSSTTGAY